MLKNQNSKILISLDGMTEKKKKMNFLSHFK